MNVRWLWFDHFPAELELTQDERARAVLLANAHRKREPKYRGAGRRADLIGLMAGLPILGAYMLWRLGPGGSRSSFLPMILALYVISALAAYLTRRPFIRHALREMGYELCEDCGYWLRGLGDDVKHCPECGAARELLPRSSRSEAAP